jgi:hypothetical protein
MDFSSAGRAGRAGCDLFVTRIHTSAIGYAHDCRRQRGQLNLAGPNSPNSITQQCFVSLA